MRVLVLILSLVLIGCAPGKQRSEKIHEIVTGNWFVLYPDEEIKSPEDQELYARVQDSLVNLKGVKLVTFEENGSFTQWDSTGQQGKWAVMEEDRMVVNRAGRGFENFKTVFGGVEDNVMILTENVNLGTGQLTLNWHLKRIDGGKYARLFKPGENTWRKAPAAPETEQAMRNRLAVIMEYYADYFRLISEESSYFIMTRVMLPFKFYQHAIGLTEMNENHRFVSLFSSFSEAQKAYNLLKEVINDAEIDLADENSDSYSKEYAQMLEIFAKDMKAKTGGK